MTDDAGAPGKEKTAEAQRLRAMNGRKVTAILALMVGIVPLSLYAYNLERNLRARSTLDKACREVREQRDARLSSELIETLFEDDAPFVIAALRESVDRPCNEAAARLAPWRWNLRMSYTLPRDPAKTARLSAALERAKARCPHLMMQAFDEMPGRVDPARSAAAAAEACAPLDEAARELTFIPEERYTAWQWASRMAAVARAFEGSPSARP